MYENIKEILPGLNAALIVLLILIFFKGDTVWLLAPLGAFQAFAKPTSNKIVKWFSKDISLTAQAIVFGVLSIVLVKEVRDKYTR